MKTTATERHTRKLESALAMAVGGANESERAVFRDKAKQLAEKYGLLNILEDWDIAKESKEQSNYRGKSNSERIKNVGVSKMCSFVDEQDWTDYFMTKIANAFALKVVKRNANKEDFDEGFITLQEKDELFVYDFVGDPSRVLVATELALNAIDMASEMETNSQFIQDNFNAFMIELAKTIARIIKARKDEEEEKSGTVVLYNPGIVPFIEQRYGKEISLNKKVAEESRLSLTLDSKTKDKLTAEAYIAARKVKA